MIFTTLPFARRVPPDVGRKQCCIKLCRQRPLDVSATSVMDARRVTPRGTRGREEKWRVLATSRREKRGRAFLRKVGREGIRLYTTRRARVPTVRRAGGTLAGEASLATPTPAGCRAWRPCLKARVVRPLSHVTVFRRAAADKSHTEFNLFGDGDTLCRNGAPRARNWPRPRSANVSRTADRTW